MGMSETGKENGIAPRVGPDYCPPHCVSSMLLSAERCKQHLDKLTQRLRTAEGIASTFSNWIDAAMMPSQRSLKCPHVLKIGETEMKAPSSF